MTDAPPPHGRPRPPAGSSPPAPPQAPPAPPAPPAAAAAAAPGGTGRTPIWRTLLYILVPIVGLLLLIFAFVFALAGRSGPVDLAENLEAGTSLDVRISNASFTLEPSTDGRVHVRMTGSYFGSEPSLAARTSNDVTEVRGGCRAQFFSRCSVTVAVQLPADLPTTVTGQNGRIMASGLTGRVSLTTTNGAIETQGTVDRVDLRTTNGDIRVTDAASATVAGTTTNGSVTMQFVNPPESVDAGSTNGSVTVRVPVDGVTYKVTAQTTNGNVNSGSVPSDSTSRRSIDAQTTNGGVTIEAVD
jgi:hypothetical protein